MLHVVLCNTFMPHTDCPPCVCLIANFFTSLQTVSPSRHQNRQQTGRGAASSTKCHEVSSQRTAHRRMSEPFLPDVNGGIARDCCWPLLVLRLLHVSFHLPCLIPLCLILFTALHCQVA